MFEGNKDSKSISKQVLPVPVEAAYVRIFPLRFEGWICMRAELYGRGTHSAASRLCRVFDVCIASESVTPQITTCKISSTIKTVASASE